jgi:adenylosuccinate lyase
LQRTDLGELEEPFGKGQKGSSAMPHKRNPVSCEQLTGLARVLRADMLAAFENVALWHERDISHSSVERVIVPDATTLLHYMLHHANRILAGARPNAERMAENLMKTRGLIYSQRILLALVEKGMTREDAYAIVQRNAMKTWENRRPLDEHLLADAEFSARIDEGELRDLMRPEAYLKHLDAIYSQCGV